MRAAAALTAGFALALLVGGLTDRLVLLLATALLQAMLAAAWLPALRVHGAALGGVVTAGAAGAADVSVLAADQSRPMAHVPAVTALALVAALAHQLVRRDGRPGLASSLSGVVMGAVLAVLGSAWLAVDVSQDGTPLLVLGVVAATAAALAVTARPTAVPRAAAAGLAGLVTLAAAGVAAAAADVGWLPALAVGTGAGISAGLGALTVRRLATPHPALTGALPLLLAAPAVYLLDRLVPG